MGRNHSPLLRGIVREIDQLDNVRLRALDLVRQHNMKIGNAGGNMLNGPLADEWSKLVWALVDAGHEDAEQTF